MNESRESDQICKERNKRQEGLAVNLRIGIHSAKIKLVCVVFSLRLGIDPIRRGGGDYISPKVPLVPINRVPQRWQPNDEKSALIPIFSIHPFFGLAVAHSSQRRYLVAVLEENGIDLT